MDPNLHKSFPNSVFISDPDHPRGKVGNCLLDIMELKWCYMMFTDATSKPRYAILQLIW